MTNASTKTTQLLVVDDDPSMVRLLKKIIERQFENEIELTSLTDPKEARRQIEAQIVDILITDLEMPGVNGLELLRCAKRRNACTQVLFMTGHSTLDALTDALELGATDYLIKPLDQAQLIKLVGDAQERLLRWREALAGTLHAAKERQGVPAG
ncbi:MAG: response regulator [Planctomycetota bacterium]|nr:response regulator [Planctomycetota bacterium]